MSSFYDDSEEEYVRPADSVVIERLIGPSSRERGDLNNEYSEESYDSYLNADLKDVLEKSVLEYYLSLIEKQEKEEKDQIQKEKEEEEKKQRQDSIANIVKKINYLSGIDRVAYEVKLITDPFIDMYISYGVINTNNGWDNSTKILVTSYLKTVRILEREKELLKSILSISL
jgi:hypothetical protein